MRARCGASSSAWPKGGLGGRAIFEAVSLQLQQHGYIPRGGQIVDATRVRARVEHTLAAMEQMGTMARRAHFA
jgi:hypothetical protein